MAQPSKMIVGLGNPGADYSFNRHNIGFMVVDALAYSWRTSAWQKKFKAHVATAETAGHTILLIKPSTYMNLSGEAVSEALRYYKLASEDVIAIHDDIDLLPAQVRVKKGGGHGGHNGLRSLDAHIGKDYWRVRLGVGHPGHKDQVSDYVLGNFGKADKLWLEPMIETMPEAMEKLLDGDQAAFLKQVIKP